MAVNQYSELDEIARDALREIGNIGTGNAVTSLSVMTNTQLDMDLPSIEIVPFQDVPEMLGGAEMIQVGILLEISKDLKGTFMFLLNEEFTKLLLKELLGTEVDVVEQLDEMSRSAISEIGNIMCCSYINAISSMLNLDIHISLPSVCCDMAGALLSVPMIKYANLGNELMFIENKFTFDQLSMTSHILFLPEFESLNFMLEKLGLPYE